MSYSLSNIYTKITGIGKLGEMLDQPLYLDGWLLWQACHFKLTLLPSAGQEMSNWPNGGSALQLGVKAGIAHSIFECIMHPRMWTIPCYHMSIAFSMECYTNVLFTLRQYFLYTFSGKGQQQSIGAEADITQPSVVLGAGLETPLTWSRWCWRHFSVTVFKTLHYTVDRHYWQWVVTFIHKLLLLCFSSMYSNTCLTALCPWLPGWAGTRKVKPIWILLKQKTVSGNGIGWAVCKAAPCPRQITTPTPTIQLNVM